jgi:4-coumarate--CoA ligase
MPKFNLQDFSRIVKTFAITDAAVVPPIITSLLCTPTDSQDLHSLRYVLCAGAPTSPALQAQLYRILSPRAVVAQVWGTTELAWQSMFSWNEMDKSGSVGRLLSGVELKLVGESGDSITQDLIHGEAYVRSPSMFVGYHNNPEATASAFDEDGFYRTGDRVYVDNNKVYIDGRVKDTMKINGWQVSPTEIEATLLQHPMIADAAVVGVDAVNDAGLDATLPRAYVVLHADTPPAGSHSALPLNPRLAPTPILTEQEVIDYAASKFVSYKRLSGGVIFIDQIPRNPTGKILRRLLCDTLELGTPASRSDASVAMSPTDSDHEAMIDDSDG